MSNSTDVKEFTEGSTGKECPQYPVAMQKDSVVFLIKMVISELDELMCTVSQNKDEKDKLMLEAFQARDECKDFDHEYQVKKIAAQADAMVDAWYYMLNASAKHGMNLSDLFKVVHQANMNKRDPKTGKFVRRASDGKIVKPEGWMPPDIEKEIQRQLEFGSWTSQI